MSVAAKVEIYVSKRPYIKEALAEGIVNYSALGRKICSEKGINSLEATKAALSRYEGHVSASRSKRKEKVVEVLQNTDLEVKSGVKVRKEELEDSIVASKTANGYTSVASGGEKALISLESPGVLEDTPGVLEFILSSLAAEGINVDHLISCREDTHLIVDNRVASEALEILQGRIS